MVATSTLKYFSTLTRCSCPDWVYRHRSPGQPCKHVAALQHAKALLDAQGAYNLTKGIPRPYVALPVPS